MVRRRRLRSRRLDRLTTQAARSACEPKGLTYVVAVIIVVLLPSSGFNVLLNVPIAA